MLMKSKVKIVVLILFFMLVVLSPKIYAKYNYIFRMEAFSLTRDSSEIEYHIERNIEEGEYTNQDVILKIIANKEIEPKEGFELSEDRMSLKRVITENETNSVTLEDMSGNQKQVNYSVNNIDKIPPEILGVEDGETYNEEKFLDYTDNIGIKNIFVDKYDTKLRLRLETDFYDTNWYYGLGVTGDKIIVELTTHPKNTRYYAYYLNNQLIAKIESPEYTYVGLSYGTDYTVKIEALDENNTVLDSISKTVKTRYFTDITSTREGDVFTVTLSGIDPRVDIGYCALWNEEMTPSFFSSLPTINQDRTLTLSYNANEVSGKKISGYYYLHVNFIGNDINDTIPINVIFGEKYIKWYNLPLDPYHVSSNGNYQIVVTDLVGNKTEKDIIIKR